MRTEYTFKGSSSFLGDESRNPSNGITPNHQNQQLSSSFALKSPGMAHIKQHSLDAKRISSKNLTSVSFKMGMKNERQLKASMIAKAPQTVTEPVIMQNSQQQQLRKLPPRA